MKRKVLIIDPDKRSRKLMSSVLCNNYDTVLCESITEGNLSVTACLPDIIIIDPVFPENEGTEFIKSVKRWSDCQIIAVSGSVSEKFALLAFNAGADDYIRKPFFTNEFLARVDLCAKRINLIESAKGICQIEAYKNGDLFVDLSAHTVTLKDTQIHLTKNEFKILALLCRHAGKVLTYDFILKSVWGPRVDNKTGILRVNIANLRKKIEDTSQKVKYLHTENGVGFRILENEF